MIGRRPHRYATVPVDAERRCGFLCPRLPDPPLSRPRLRTDRPRRTAPRRRAGCPNGPFVFVTTVENDVTCLIGKNEPGKTTVLKALQRPNPANGSDRFDLTVD
ncbi:hypothetical protein Sspor_78030 [Streptomyces spororaveus]|uniref:ABC transporter domain-containing protein n=1 Tax=Streptomyces spororaveus TaxID=284039 RepID=A0ABQ3TP89_9ACTN|nr:hypothetical protein Sspor_78030 [Streptomyces spororaveus]